MIELNSDLPTALGEFQKVLSPDQTAQLSLFSDNEPTAEDIVRITDQITKTNAGRKSRVFASRVQGFLSSIQQYCAIIDTAAGPNQIPGLIWASVKLVILVCA